MLAEVAWMLVFPSTDGRYDSCETSTIAVWSRVQRHKEQGGRRVVGGYCAQVPAQGLDGIIQWKRHRQGQTSLYRSPYVRAPCFQFSLSNGYWRRALLSLLRLLLVLFHLCHAVSAHWPCARHLMPHTHHDTILYLIRGVSIRLHPHALNFHSQRGENTLKDTHIIHIVTRHYTRTLTRYAIDHTKKAL
jgi:hypothetical protein